MLLKWIEAAFEQTSGVSLKRTMSNGPLMDINHVCTKRVLFVYHDNQTTEKQQPKALGAKLLLWALKAESKTCESYGPSIAHSSALESIQKLLFCFSANQTAPPFMSLNRGLP